MNLSIRFFLNWQDYFGAQEFFRDHRYSVAPEKIIGGVVMVASAVWFFLDDLNLAATSGLALGLIIIFGAPRARRWASKRKWRREPLYQTEHAVSFSDEGVHFLMGHVESNLDWLYYQRLVESPEGFLLIYGDDAFNFFPKRAFDGESRINEFRRLAQKKLKK